MTSTPEQQSAKSVNIAVHRIYSKNQRVQIHGLPEEWSQQSNPKIDLQANPRVQNLNDRSEVTLALQLTAKREDEPVFEIYFEQAGLFTVTAANPEQQEMILYGACSNMLFPYAGVMINQILTQSNLQPVYLAPLDFVKLYQQHKQRQQQTAQKEQEQSAVGIQ